MRRFLFWTTLLVVTLLAGLSFAQSYDVGSTLDALRADRDAGVLTLDQWAVNTAYALFDSAKLPVKYYRQTTNVRELAGVAPSWFCGTAAVQALREALPDLSPEARAKVARFFPPAGVRPAGPVEAKQDFPDGIDLPNSYKTEHFAIRWGNSASPDMNMIEDWADALEDEIWQTEIEDWGYQDIAQTDTYYLNVYIGNSGDGAPEINFDGAYTSVMGDYYDGMPYIVMAPSILGYLDSLREVSAHEFYHTTQFTHFLVDGCYWYMGETETWFVEATATWAESRVYTDIDNYLYYIYDWAENPHKPLTDNSYSTAGPYARVIWAMYLDQYYDGLDTIYEIWNACYSGGTLYGNSAYLEDRDLDWAEEYLKFMAAVVLRDFDDTPPDFNVLTRVQSYPFDQNAVPSSSKPYTNGMNIYELLDAGEESAIVNVQFVGGELDSSRKEWAIGVLKMTSSSQGELEIVDMSGDNATFSVDGMGTTYQKMYLLISPVSGKVTDSSSRYDYSLSITRGDDPFPTDDDTADDDDDDLDDDDDSGSDDDNDDGLDCSEFCQRVSACGLFDELGLTNDNCLDQCESASADAVQCVLDAADCDETAMCVGVSGGDDDDDDDSSGGCS